MPSIVISYRRNDTAAVAGRIYDSLVSQFGNYSVFLDTSDIPIGEDLKTFVKRRISNADVLLVVIGPKWMNSILSDENDFIRMEIEAALQSNITTIPVLVDNASLNPSQLPGSLRDLANRQGVKIGTGQGFKSDLGRLVRTLESIFHSSQKRAGAEQASEKAGRSISNDSSSANIPASVTQQQSPRTSPEYWLNRVSVERKLPPGDQPLVLISFSSED